MKVTDIMIDLETLGSKNDAIIVSVGVVYFNLTSKTVVDKRYWILNIDSQSHRTIDISNLKWWMTQSEGVREVFREPQQSCVSTFISEFEDSFNEREVKRFWAKGAHFDFGLLNNLLKSEGDPYKNCIPYSKWMCMKPIYVLATRLGVLRTMKLEGTAHNALDDAVFQTEVLLRFIDKIGI